MHNNPSFDIAIAYLTPFNRKRAGEAADRLQTVQLFQAFAEGDQQSGSACELAGRGGAFVGRPWHLA